MSFCMVLFFCFFFKQKTAYEMRISDWSSDVCSSDLCYRGGRRAAARRRRAPTNAVGRAAALPRLRQLRARLRARHLPRFHHRLLCDRPHRGCAAAGAGAAVRRLPALRRDARAVRSEEHTSELQSLMRISYAVFCLKKKKKKKREQHIT